MSATTTPDAEPQVSRGDRVELVSVTDEYKHFGLAAGDLGTFLFTDSLGTIHVWWDTAGRTVGVISEDRALLRPARP
ncbi:MAG TPA: DUF4314 domain-containing protein [Streptosporangiaceae bacterium]|nr:DUF4314 domain-containing protein [Streptosporangiaceae bacterium]